MSLTRAFLKSLELDDDKIESIISAHSDTVSGLQARYAELETRYNAAKETAEKLDAVQKELDAVQKELDGLRAGDWQGRYEALLAENAAREQRAAKETAARAYYREKNIRDSRNLDIAMRGTDLDGLTLTDDGKLADTAPLDELVAGVYAPLVGPVATVSTSGSLNGRGGDAGRSASDIMNEILRQ